MKLSLAVSIVLVMTSVNVNGQPYDPLLLPKGNSMETADLTVKDASRDRDIPLRA